MSGQIKRSALLWVGTCCLAIFGFVSTAHAWDVTFTRDKDGNRSSSSFNLAVVMNQQTGGNGTSTQGRCNINWNNSSCTIEDFPSTSNALVTIYHRVSTSGGQDTVIGKISFWVGVFSDSEIHIPTGVVSFKADKTWNELLAVGGVKFAILPQSNVEMGDTLSNRPNGGTGFYGYTLGNCGQNDLASNTGNTCEIDFLAGCYSPVFARPLSGTPAKIWVNKTDSGPADHVMCVSDDQIVDYTIKVQ